jgi:hypothetical protein
MIEIPRSWPHNIPHSRRLLTVTCFAGASRRRPRVVQFVLKERNPEYRVGDRAAPEDYKRVPCDCAEGGHDINSAKLHDAVERLRNQPEKRRRVDVRTLI